MARLKIDQQPYQAESTMRMHRSHERHLVTQMIRNTRVWPEGTSSQTVDKWCDDLYSSGTLPSVEQMEQSIKDGEGDDMVATANSEMVAQPSEPRRYGGETAAERHERYSAELRQLETDLSLAVIAEEIVELKKKIVGVRIKAQRAKRIAAREASG